MNRNILAVVIFFCLATQLLFAQGIGSSGSADARSMSTGKTFTVSSFGIYAAGKNPANLYQDSTKRVEIILPIPIPNISGSIGTNFLSIEDYNYFFATKVTNTDGSTEGRLLTEADKNRLKSLFSDGGTLISDVSIQLLSLSIQPSRMREAFAFTISDRISSLVTLPKSIIDLGIDGNLPNKVYNFSDSQFKAWWLRKYSLSYSRDLKIFPKLFNNFYFGVSVNLVNGFAYAGLDKIKTELKTGSQNVIEGTGSFLALASFSPSFNVKYNFDKTANQKDFSFNPFPTPAGSGVGFDLGFNAILGKVVSIGASLTDIGKITWDKNAAQYSSQASFYLDDLTDQAQRDTLVNRLTGKDNGKYISSFTTEMATAFHFGIGFQIEKLFKTFAGKMLLSFDYHQGFNDMPGNSKTPRFGIGIDWNKLSIFALRTGFVFGGYEKFGWGLGLGLNFGLLEMNFGSPDFHYILSQKTAKRVSFAVDSRWRF